MTEELERWGVDPTEPDVPEPYRAAAAAYRALEPAQPQVERMLQKLELARAATRAQVSLWRRAGFWRTTSLSVLGVGGALLGWQIAISAPWASNELPYRPLKETAKEARAELVPELPVQPPPSESSLLYRSRVSPAPPAVRPSSATESGASEPSAPKADSRGATRPAGPALYAELELLQRARRIVRLKPARALSLTHEHARAFPQGLFVQERELIAVEAELGLGRREQAERRARQFEARYRDSLHRTRLQALLAQ